MVIQYQWNENIKEEYILTLHPLWVYHTEKLQDMIPNRLTDDYEMIMGKFEGCKKRKSIISIYLR